jgi:hypothetical protein
VVEGGFAPGDPVTPWNLKDRPAALGSNRIGLDLRCARLALRSCWPGLPSEFEANFVNALGVAMLQDRQRNRSLLTSTFRGWLELNSVHPFIGGKLDVSDRSPQSARGLRDFSR